MFGVLKKANCTLMIQPYVVGDFTNTITGQNSLPTPFVELESTVFTVESSGKRKRPFKPYKTETNK